MVSKLAAWARAARTSVWAFAWTVGGRTAKVDALLAQSDFSGASRLLLRLLRGQPTQVSWILLLAYCQKRLLRNPVALDLLRQACQLDDRNPDVLLPLVQSLLDARLSDEALSYLVLLKDEPGIAPKVDQILGTVALSRGDASRAKEFQLSAWLSEFESRSAGNGYLFPLAYAETDEARLAQEHQFWADTLAPWTEADAQAPPVRQSQAFKALLELPKPATKSTKIRLAYWGADFREHSVRYFSRPLIENHDRSRFEVFIYSQNDPEMRYDVHTEAFKAAADHFYDVGPLSDAELEALMLSHQLDVLVELSGHTAGNRLPMLMRRLATVQLTGLAYPPTTGLRNIDGKFMDPNIRTPHSASYYAENPLVLPNSLWCFDPLISVPSAGPPPVERNGFLTFACMGNLAKITPEMIACWSQILSRLPSARFLIQSPSLGDSTVAQAFSARLQAAHINLGQIDLRPAQPTAEFWTRYQEIDLILDTFPFNGGTTSCYSAYAGVPLLTLSGQSLISRVGRSIVCNLGFPTLAVDSYADYVARALELAGDGRLLAEFRREAPARFKESSLGNGKKFATELEQALVALLQQARAGTLVNVSAVAPLPQQLMLDRAELVAYHGHTAGAKRILDLCLKRYPACGAAYVLRARQMARLGELSEAQELLQRHLPELAVTDALAAQLLVAQIALTQHLPQDAHSAVAAIDRLGPLPPQQARQLRLLSAALQDESPLGSLSEPNKEPAMAQGSALSVLVLTPCRSEADLVVLEQRSRSHCLHPEGWDIEYRRCDPRDRVAAYNQTLADSEHDILVLMQPGVTLHNPALFEELADALEDADVVGCGGALRWVQKDWTLDLPTYRAWGLLRPSAVNAAMVEVHLGGDFDQPIVAGAVVLDSKFLACKPAAVRGVEFDEELYDSHWLAEEDWTHRLQAAGRRLSIHRHLGLLVAGSHNPIVPGISHGQKQLVQRLQIDPLALTIRNYENISVPVVDAAAGVRVLERFFTR